MGEIDPKTGIHTRLLDFQKALNFCIDYALNIMSIFFFFPVMPIKPPIQAQHSNDYYYNVFCDYIQAKIPVIIIVGNHDNPLSFGKANRLDTFCNLPVDGFHVMAKPTIITSRN